jgi:hypothetical protein
VQLIFSILQMMDYRSLNRTLVHGFRYQWNLTNHWRQIAASPTLLSRGTDCLLCAAIMIVQDFSTSEALWKHTGCWEDYVHYNYSFYSIDCCFISSANYMYSDTSTNEDNSFRDHIR